jgi:hypothetical protein
MAELPSLLGPKTKLVIDAGDLTSIREVGVAYVHVPGLVLEHLSSITLN